MGNEIELNLNAPLRYRWSGRFAAKDTNWIHMERQLVDYELIAVERGVLYIEDERERYEVGEGQYLLMEPAKLQRGWRKSKCRFYWMHFWPMQEEKQMSDKMSLPRQGNLKNPERLFVLFKQLQDSDIRYMDSAYNGYLATTILLELANQRKQSGEAGGTESLQARVDDHLYRHMSEHISVGDLAREFGYHEKYFSALFKKTTGQSVKQYMDERKVDRAKYLLLNSDAWVSEIAEHLGYAEVQNFYHVFKKATNCTPSEFRNMYQKKQDTHV